jgi:hypothetical protein
MASYLLFIGRGFIDMHIRGRIARFGTVLLIAAPLAVLGAPAAAHADALRVPCHGFGSEGVLCVIDLEGRAGVASVWGNPNFEWVFILHCSLFGDQESGANPPRQGEVQSVLECNGGASATGGSIEAI